MRKWHSHMATFSNGVAAKEAFERAGFPVYEQEMVGLTHFLVYPKKPFPDEWPMRDIYRNGVPYDRKLSPLAFISDLGVVLLSIGPHFADIYENDLIGIENQSTQ